MTQEDDLLQPTPSLLVPLENPIRVIRAPSDITDSIRIARPPRSVGRRMDPVFRIEVFGDLASDRVGEVDRGPVVVEQVGGRGWLGVDGDRAR